MVEILEAACMSLSIKLSSSICSYTKVSLKLPESFIFFAASPAISMIPLYPNSIPETYYSELAITCARRNMKEGLIIVVYPRLGYIRS